MFPIGIPLSCRAKWNVQHFYNDACRRSKETCLHHASVLTFNPTRPLDLAECKWPGSINNSQTLQPLSEYLNVYRVINVDQNAGLIASVYTWNLYEGSGGSATAVKYVELTARDLAAQTSASAGRYKHQRSNIHRTVHLQMSMQSVKQ